MNPNDSMLEKFLQKYVIIPGWAALKDDTPSGYIKRSEYGQQQVLKEVSRLLVQAKLEALRATLKMNGWHEGDWNEAIKQEIAALQSQLEGEAGVANDKPVVPPEVKSNGGESSA